MSIPTTGGKNEQNIVFVRKSLRTSQHGTKNIKTYNMTKWWTPLYTSKTQIT